MTKRIWTTISIAIAGLVISIVLGLVGMGLVFSALYRTIAAQTDVVTASWIIAALLILLSIIGVLALVHFIRSLLAARQLEEQKAAETESQGMLGGVNFLGTTSNFIRRFPMPTVGLAVVAGIVFARSPAVRRLVWRTILRVF